MHPFEGGEVAAGKSVVAVIVIEQESAHGAHFQLASVIDQAFKFICERPSILGWYNAADAGTFKDAGGFARDEPDDASLGGEQLKDFGGDGPLKGFGVFERDDFDVCPFVGFLELCSGDSWVEGDGEVLGAGTLLEVG